MKPYIYGAKNGIHIIDLQATARGLVGAARFVSATVSGGGQVLFVGTKRAASAMIKEEAERAGQFYVNHRWLGGTMTNWQTVKKSIDRLLALERARDEGRFQVLTKKEALELTRDIERMSRTLGGIKTMKGLPAALFVIDPKREHIAVTEARKLNIPVVGLCDSNCDPSDITHVIPGNDDALKSIRLFTSVMADAAIEGRAMSTKRSPETAAYAGVNPDADVSGVEVVRRHAPDASVPADATASPPPEPVES